MAPATAVIRQQYDELIAPGYDRDPQSVAGDAVAKAIAQITGETELFTSGMPLRALDVGAGTGRFFERLRKESVLLEPFGLDTSAEMLRIAHQRIPDLTAAVGDAEELGSYFPGDRFDLVSTHFVTGYVPIERVAAEIHEKLRPGGYWSFVGGTLRAFPGLLSVADSRLFRLAFGVGNQRIEDHVINPADEDEVVNVMKKHGFDVRTLEVSLPPLQFDDFSQFLEFAHEGGWLTPIVEQLGLHRAGRITRAILNSMVFPMTDHHDIVIALARREGE